MGRTGGVVEFQGRESHGRVKARAHLIAEAPADAPVVVHASFGAVNVNDMSGPVRVTAAHARARILGTTGRVDATGSVVDFEGSKGEVLLTAEAEINLKLNSRFDGSLVAWAQRSVRVLLPKGFLTPFQAVVARPENFICRTGFSAEIKMERKDGLYFFTYGGDGNTPPEKFGLRSEHATVVMDMSESTNRVQ
ncbi:MAG TPA: hypothetical protein VGL89_17485 [Candidatus Koribacter sp.]|jgi:hypothetical protein